MNLFNSIAFLYIIIIYIELLFTEGNELYRSQGQLNLMQNTI